MRAALFLDRDGVINVDHGYVISREAFEFVAGIRDLAAAAHRAGLPIIVVTNQAGIGRGFYTEDAFVGLMSWVADEFLTWGTPLTAVYYCPHHAQYGLGEYQRDCDCRKPKPGMLLRAARDFNLDLARSVLVGDKLSDIAAGAAAGVGSLFLLSRDEPAGPAQRVTSVAEAVVAVRTATASLGEQLSPTSATITISKACDFSETSR
jgi:D-glycero-D-manno-heptose 1,7-bisphosphate phosphatase